MSFPYKHPLDLTEREIAYIEVAAARRLIFRFVVEVPVSDSEQCRRVLSFLRSQQELDFFQEDDMRNFLRDLRDNWQRHRKPQPLTV